MYDNIGGKIKGLAVVIAVIEAIAGTISGLVMLFTDEDLILYGLLIIASSWLFSWISTWLLYGFGELIELTSIIASNTRSSEHRQSIIKPAPVHTTTTTASPSSAAKTSNGWRCSCGKEHPAYVSSCSCGVNKSEIS